MRDFQSAPQCAATEASAGKDCIGASTGSVTRKYTDRGLPATDIAVSAPTGRSLQARFSNGNAGAWNALTIGEQVDVRIWRGSIVAVDGTPTVAQPVLAIPIGVGVVAILFALAFTPFAIWTIRRERARYRAEATT